MKNGISIVGHAGSAVEATSDALTEFIGVSGERPDYLVMTKHQAEWCISNVMGKKVKTKQGRILKFSGLSVVVV